MRQQLLAILLISLATSDVYSRQTSPIEALTEKGREAHQKLLETVTFSIGTVGFAGRVAAAELALHTLLKEEHAIAALTDLLSRATDEGRMYALYGLRLKDAEAFQRFSEQYKAQDQAPRGIKVLTGCLLMTEDQNSVIAKIDAGHYDASFRLGANRD